MGEAQNLKDPIETGLPPSPVVSDGICGEPFVKGAQHFQMKQPAQQHPSSAVMLGATSWEI